MKERKGLEDASEYAALKTRVCEECHETKLIIFHFTRTCKICKTCEALKRRTQRHREGHDPKLRWRSYGRKKEK